MAAAGASRPSRALRRHPGEEEGGGRLLAGRLDGLAGASFRRHRELRRAALRGVPDGLRRRSVGGVFRRCTMALIFKGFDEKDARYPGWVAAGRPALRKLGTAKADGMVFPWMQAVRGGSA